MGANASNSSSEPSKSFSTRSDIVLPQALKQLDRIQAHQQIPPSIFIHAVKIFSGLSFTWILP
ncbi:hypothetical protein [Xanthomonas hortorum]|uniref:hypothetical protein n=1 Tax=Xanthomonas hortorum TaxID=56454 RepID=UPI001474BDC7|nr:hypothetical protein [Xanthomonas hortorum]